MVLNAMRLSLTSALAIVVTAGGLAGQQAPPPFRVEVNYVEVDAMVTDRDDRFVDDLAQEDFHVFEDGKAQNIATFSFVDLPIERRASSSPEPDVDPDVSVNARPRPGRLYLFVLDDLHTSSLRTPLVRAAARQFVERHLGADDLVSVVQTGGTTETTQDFTSSQARIVRAIDSFTGRKLRSPTLDALESHRPQTVKRAQDARAALLTIRRLADSLASVQGRRKALVYFSEGLDAEIDDYINNRDAASVSSAVRETVSSATRANVVIYSVDPRGLTSLGDELMDAQGVPINPHVNLGPASLLAELNHSQDSLRILAEQTGGFAALDGNALQQAFDRITVDNSRYYVLGYYSTNQRRDGRFRTIEVRSRRPGLKIQARRGYLGPSDNSSSRKRSDRDGSPELRAALDRALPTGGLSLRATATAFKGAGPGATVVVAIETSARELAFANKNGRFENVIELSLAAVDGKGTVREHSHRALTVDLGPDAYRRATEAGLRLLSTLSLPPGRYQLRTAAREAGSGTLGSVFHDVDVPDFAGAPLSMSGLVLTSVAGTTTPTLRVDQKEVPLPALPSTTRDFTSKDELVLFAEIYDRATVPHAVDVTAIVRTGDGREVFRHHQESASDGSNAAGGFGYVARIRLEELPPGDYVVTVDAESRLSNGGRATRQVPFRIRP